MSQPKQLIVDLCSVDENVDTICEDAKTSQSNLDIMKLYSRVNDEVALSCQILSI